MLNVLRATPQAALLREWLGNPARTPDERIAGLVSALKRHALAWENIVELRLLPPQYDETAQKLGEEVRSLIATWETGPAILLKEPKP